MKFATTNEESAYAPYKGITMRVVFSILAFVSFTSFYAFESAGQTVSADGKILFKPTGESISLFNFSLVLVEDQRSILVLLLNKTSDESEAIRIKNKISHIDRFLSLAKTPTAYFINERESLKAELKTSVSQERQQAIHERLKVLNSFLPHEINSPQIEGLPVVAFTGVEVKEVLKRKPVEEGAAKEEYNVGDLGYVPNYQRYKGRASATASQLMGQEAGLRVNFEQTVCLDESGDFIVFDSNSQSYQKCLGVGSKYGIVPVTKEIQVTEKAMVRVSVTRPARRTGRDRVWAGSANGNHFYSDFDTFDSKIIGHKKVWAGSAWLDRGVGPFRRTVQEEHFYGRVPIYSETTKDFKMEPGEVQVAKIVPTGERYVPLVFSKIVLNQNDAELYEQARKEILRLTEMLLKNNVGEPCKQ